MKHHTLHGDRHHFHWDNQLPAALEVDPGDSVELEIRDASDGQITRGSSAADIGRLQSRKKHREKMGQITRFAIGDIPK